MQFCIAYCILIRIFSRTCSHSQIIIAQDKIIRTFRFVGYYLLLNFVS
jgi:hypothetical protein